MSAVYRRLIPKPGRRGTQFPSSGSRKKAASPLKVLPAAQNPSQPAVDIEEARRLARDCVISVEQLLSGHDGSFSIADPQAAWKYDAGKSLVRPDLLDSLSTLKRQLHQWYLTASNKGLHTLMVKITEEHFFHDDSVYIYLEDLFHLYNLDALDKSIISTYCLQVINLFM